MKIKFFFYYLLPIIIYMWIIFYFSSQPIIGVEVFLKEKVGLSIERWALHIIEYAILSFLLYRALVKSRLKKKSFLLAIVISVFYALSDEIHQIFVIGRSFDFIDLILDGIGSFLMQILIKLKKFYRGNE